MALITLDNVETQTIGELPEVGSIAPDFTLTGVDLRDVNLSAYAGSKKIMSIFPSVETGVCSKAAQRINELAGEFKNTVILSISADLPFAASRFCSSSKLQNIVSLSCYRYPEFGRLYGVTILNGAFKGLLARAVLLLDQNNRVMYSQLVREIANEPDYEAIRAAIHAA
jgi:thiol peroxidase